MRVHQSDHRYSVFRCCVVVLGGFNSEVRGADSNQTNEQFRGVSTQGGFSNVDDGVVVGGHFSIREAQDIVGDLVQDYLSSRLPRKAPKIQANDLDWIMDYIERVLADHTPKGAAGGWCKWRWIWLAGVLYDNLDRRRVLALLERCAAKVSRPPDITDQWFLAKFLQGFLTTHTMHKLSGLLGATSEEGCESTLIIHDWTMGRHFVRFPATTESERQVVYSMLRIAHWLFATKEEKGNFQKVLMVDGHWTSVDDLAIEMTSFLYTLWGPERFRIMTRTVRKLLPVNAQMSDACFLACFLRAVGCLDQKPIRTFCADIGFSFQGENKLWIIADQGPEIFRRLPQIKLQTNGPLNASTTVNQVGPSSNVTPSFHDVPSKVRVGQPVDAHVEEVQKFVADMIHEFRNKIGESSLAMKPVGNAGVHEKVLRNLEQKTLNPKRITTCLAADTGACGWRRARLAGELYDRLDRGRLVALLERCATVVRRPAGMSDQWYLAKLIQSFVTGEAVTRLSLRIGINQVQRPRVKQRPKRMLNMPDIVMERHFCGLPETNENNKLIIWSVCQVMSWLLKTRLREPYFKLIAGRDTHYWFGINTGIIELTAFLFRLWGPERFRSVAKFARTLLPVTAAEISDACFLGCFLRGMSSTCIRVFHTLCSTTGFSYTRDELEMPKPCKDEGPEFFGRLPPNWETITTEDFNVESHPRVLSQSVAHFETAPHTHGSDSKIGLLPVAADPLTADPADPVTADPVIPTPVALVTHPRTPAMVNHSAMVNHPAMVNHAAMVNHPAMVNHAAMVNHPAMVVLSPISHEDASRSAMQHAAALHARLCASYEALDLRKRTGVENEESWGGKRGKFPDAPGSTRKRP
ncbi:hypothetical protein GNI_006340 [Gregarina niphandrodes]|uniref:Uncharacterized protein n=1 Tax=Gregarina niphandrodes TaxID=110365 RepID=A0A023BDA0_GRENI|nr:hypothetical protein GNI_006340 [Gregarina niphandrodes]EZG87755.1 hypothetical protein GNI_006340 [Gregarina niphandrodes]|eukprot:XP_011128638.1 hypothetical protein GNI_006340 [Gregarina niphandrodes]